MTRPKAARSEHRRRPTDVVSRVRPIAERFANVHGLVVWEVLFSRVAGRDMLTIAADKPGGVVSDELAVFAEDVGRELDHTDAVPGDTPYMLEVTSPGAERRLTTPEQFRVCRGLVAAISFRDGRTPVQGVIGDGDAAGIHIETGTGAERVRYEDIARAQLRVTEI